MPFIVTTKTPCPACTHGTTGGGEHRSSTVTHRAVATLEEARSLADREWACGADLGESGGSLGPLADGTVVEVKEVGWGALREALTFPSGLRPHDPNLGAQIIAVYNAKQTVAS